MKQPPMTHDERCVGRLAPWLIYYRSKAGRLYYQACYRETEADARQWIRKAVKGCTVVRVVARQPGADVLDD